MRKTAYKPHASLHRDSAKVWAEQTMTGRYRYEHVGTNSTWLWYEQYLALVWAVPGFGTKVVVFN